MYRSGKYYVKVHIGLEPGVYVFFTPLYLVKHILHVP